MLLSKSCALDPGGYTGAGRRIQATLQGVYAKFNQRSLIHERLPESAQSINVNACLWMCEHLLPVSLKESCHIAYSL